MKFIKVFFTLYFDAIECLINYVKGKDESIFRVTILLANNKLVLGSEVSTPLYQNYKGIHMGQYVTVNASEKRTVF